VGKLVVIHPCITEVDTAKRQTWAAYVQNHPLRAFGDAVHAGEGDYVFLALGFTRSDEMVCSCRSM